MAKFFWALGRALQFVALVQVGASLLLGMQTHDSTLELKLMVLGVLEFGLGLGLLRFSGRRE